MENLENTRLSLDEIAVALKRLTSGSNSESQSVEEFHTKIAAFFPQILYESNDSLWDDEEEPEKSLRPLWWDELDEEFELDELHWLTRIQKYELLKPEEVVRTMEAVEAGVFAQAALDGQLPNFDISKYRKSKILRVIEIGNDAFDYMLIHNLKLALHLARGYGRRITLDDAFSFSVFGLMQAIRKFDWRLGNQFSTYATWWIRQSLTRELADSETTIRIPVHAVERINAYKRDLRNLRNNEYTIASLVETKDKYGIMIETKHPLPPLEIQVEMDLTLTCGLEASGEALEFWDVFHQAPWLVVKYDIPDNSISGSEYSAVARDLLERLTAHVLSKQQIEVIKFRHGYTTGEPMTLDEIGKIYELTRERIRQIESKAIIAINKFLIGVTIENYWDVIEQRTLVYLEGLENTPAAIAAQKKREKEELRLKQHPLRMQNSDVNLETSSRDMSSFENANLERSRQANLVKITQVKWALEILKETEMPEQVMLFAQAKVDNPELSFTELANLFQNVAITKDAAAGAIRRLIAKASSVSGLKPPTE